METARPVPAVDVPRDEHGRLAADIACVGCGYNLRGLHPDEACAECARPIADSLSATLLRFAEPTWLATVVAGLNWILLALLLAGIGSALGNWGQKLFGWTWTSDWTSPVLLRWRSAAFCSIILITIRGCWKVTTGEPGAPAKPSRAARVLRWSLVLETLRYVVLTLIWIPLLHRGREPIAALANEFVSTAINVTQLLSVLLFGRAVAMRIPSTKLARGLMFFTLPMLIVCVSVSTLDSMCWIAGIHGGASWWTTVYSLAESFRLIEVLVGLWGVVMLLRFRHALKRCEREARSLRDAWRSAIPDPPDSRCGK